MNIFEPFQINKVAKDFQKVVRDVTSATAPLMDSEISFSKFTILFLMRVLLTAAV